MLHSDLHGRWVSEADERADLLRRQACAEMLEQLAAGGTLPYPFGDALHLLEAVRPPVDHEVRTPPDAARRRLGGILRFLTWRGDRRRMEHSGEGSGGDGRPGDSVLPVRGVPA